MYEIWHGNEKTGQHVSLEAAIELAKEQLSKSEHIATGNLHRLIMRNDVFIYAVFDDANGLRTCNVENVGRQ